MEGKAPEISKAHGKGEALHVPKADVSADSLTWSMVHGEVQTRISNLTLQKLSLSQLWEKWKKRSLMGYQEQLDHAAKGNHPIAFESVAHNHANLFVKECPDEAEFLRRREADPNYVVIVPLDSEGLWKSADDQTIMKRKSGTTRGHSQGH